MSWCRKDASTRSSSTRLRIAETWAAGEGQLVLPAAAGEEVSDLAPLRVGAGYRFSMSYSVTDLRTLADGTSSTF